MKSETAERLLKLVKRNYQEISVDFNATRKKEIWPEIREMTTDIKNDDKILDVGCGNGRLLETLKDKKLEYLGVDNSEELIKIARQNYPTFKFVVGDILDLRGIAGRFDYIFCLAVLSHLPGEELRLKALKEMKSKLKEGGRIIISVWNLWGPAKGRKDYRPLIFKNWFLKIIRQNDLDTGDLIFPWKNSRGEEISRRYYHAFRKRELKDLVNSAGLNLKVLKKDLYNYWLILD